LVYINKTTAEMLDRFNANDTCNVAFLPGIKP
jgi:hypothetical protein